MFAHTLNECDDLLSSNFILSAFLEVRLELEIHLVSSVRLVGFKVDCAWFSAKSSQIGLRTLNVVYGSGASHLKFLPVNIPTASYRCINVVFDYQLVFRTIAVGSKMEILFGFLHFAERDSPIYGPISSCFVRFSSFILPSSLAPGLSNSVAQHGNVEFQGLDPIKSSVLSSNFILSAFLEVRLELEIHLVSSVRLVGFKVDCAWFSAKSSQIGLRTLNVVYGSGASHLKFLPVNIPTASYRCINVVFDYQLVFRTIAVGSKMEILFGFLHFAERDSPIYGPISSCFVRFSSFILPSSLAPGLSNSVVNVAL
ncbi:hypothetical protein DY000_02063797 [Brassica cretica]|uniref:Uncharacterized protein n=1 Tax=Brassica cretica TaxID=69181 RepID=A0ABQ7AUI2_BRACR|nr:hypothetical protein DY000_02063797 [Brassica cretica]